MDEQKKVQTWIAGVTDELIRLRRIRPAWIQQMQTQGGPPAPQMSIAAPSIQPQQIASSSIVYSTGYKEPIYGICTTECTVSKCTPPIHGVRLAEETAPVIADDDAMAAARLEWKSAIRPAC